MNPMATNPSNFAAGLSTTSYVVMALMIGFLLVFFGLRKPGQSVFHLRKSVRWMLAAPIKMILKPVIAVALKIPFVKRSSEWLWSHMTDDALERAFDRMFHNAKHPRADMQSLLRGDSEAFARKHWPPEKYPHLWRKDIPDDIRRPLITDGRLPGGYMPATVMAPNFIDTTLVGQTFRRGVAAGIFWLIAGLLLWNPHTYFGKVFEQGVIEPAAQQQLSNTRHQPASTAFNPDAIKSIKTDFWDAQAMQQKLVELQEEKEAVAKTNRDAILASAPSGAITAILFGFLVFLGTWRGLLRSAVQKLVNPLAQQNKESTLRWKLRQEQRDLADTAYQYQIDFVTDFDKDTPLIRVAIATGLCAYRGQLGAPMKDQEICYSLTDMGQHTLLLGGTGEGKTRSIIIPVVNQLLDLRATYKGQGKPKALSFYCTDGKAVLWRDIQGAAVRKGQGDDVRVIGCRADNGEYGVDLLDGVSPQLVADIIASVARQAGGGSGGDSFWPDMASEIIRNCAIIARAWESTDDGYSVVNATGERVYSLVMIYQLTLDGAMLSRAIDAVTKAYSDDKQRASLLKFLNPELSYATNYMTNQWQEMAADTKTGIMANITKVMSPFASNPALRTSFASGSPKRLISISDAWGSICLVNVSSLEYGLAGRIVNVFLKTLLYTEARCREMANPEIGKSEKLVFVADEFQDLITADVAGMSDSNFWNVARSSGTIGFISSQAIASLEQALGQALGAGVGSVAADNFALQMRNKITLRVEDAATIEYVKKLAGKTVRSYTFADNHFESYETMVRELGYDPMMVGPARIEELPDNYISALAAGWTFVPSASSTINFQTFRPFYDEDLTFVSKHAKQMWERGKISGDEEGAAALERAVNRAQDKNLAHMADGNHESDVLHDEDIIQMGRAHAFVYIQRGGVTRMDIAKIV